MFKNSIIVLFSILMLIASCKKEEQVVCPETVIPYTSLMQAGDTVTGIKAKVFYMSAEENANGCEGFFLQTYTGRPEVLTDNGVVYHRIINTLPDYVINHSDLQNAEWLVDVKYVGLGMECYVAILVDPAPGTELEPEKMEMVEVNFIQLIP